MPGWIAPQQAPRPGLPGLALRGLQAVAGIYEFKLLVGLMSPILGLLWIMLLLSHWVLGWAVSWPLYCWAVSASL